MKKYFIYLTAVFFFSNYAMLAAQNHYNIRLVPNGASPLGKVCYDVQLASADAVDLNLAGQNYRIYYDATQLEYDANSSRILLSKEKYTDLIIKDNRQDIDASGAGPLAFDNHLSFLNVGNDLKDELNGGIILPASGEWVSTTNVCFNLVNNSAVSASDHSIFWARPELTQSYATAYVEVAEWIAPYKTIPSTAAVYFDQELNTSGDELKWEHTPIVYPNPTPDKLTIDFAGQEALSIQIYSTNGQLVLENRYPENTTQYSIDLGHLAAGIYQLRCLNKEGKQIVKKIEKIR